MSHPEQHGRDDIPREAYPKLVQAMMKRQAGLSLRVAAVFLTILFLLPLANYYWPDLAGARAGGFTATWLFLGVLFYPLTWVLSWYFIKASDRIERDCADWRKLHGEAPVAGVISAPLEANEPVGSDLK